MNKTAAILLAAGKSERFGNEIPKPFLLLGGKAIYQYSLDVFEAHPQIDEIVFVVPQEMLLIEKEKLKKEKARKTIHLVAGGETRFESVKKALDLLDESYKHVLVHDAARPFITKDLIDKCIQNLSQNEAVSCAIESTDTLVFTDEKGFANSFPERSTLYRVQTPQAFHLDVLKKTYSLASKEKKTDFTDDASLIHYYDLAPIFLVPGSEKNIKITYPSDLALAEQILLIERGLSG